MANLMSFSPLVDYMASFRCSPRLMVLRILVIFYSIYCLDAQQQVAQKPHIIMIVADDLVSDVFF